MKDKASLRRLAPWLVMLGMILFSEGVIAGISCAAGGTCTQTIQLNPGWNSIYVKVNPTEPSTDIVFADLLDGSGAEISSVWTFLAYRSKLDYISDPDAENLLSKPGWLRYFPEDSDESFLTNLFSISGNRAYLVKLEGSEVATLTVSGTPLARRQAWISGTLNFIGFHIDEATPPTFADFFASSHAQAASSIFELNSASGTWQLVNTLGVMQADTAYWIFSNGGSNFAGPVSLENVRNLNFGSVIDTLALRFLNESDNSLTINVRIVGDSAPVRYRNPDLSSETDWLALPQLGVNLSENGTFRTVLGVRRIDFSQVEYGDILEVVVPGYSRWLIPLVASAPNLVSSYEGLGHEFVNTLVTAGNRLLQWLVTDAQAQNTADLTGLWVGSVSIDQVSQANNYRFECINALSTYQNSEDDETDLDFSGFVGTRIIQNEAGEDVILMVDEAELLNRIGVKTIDDPLDPGLDPGEEAVTQRAFKGVYVGLDPTLYPELFEGDEVPESLIARGLCTDLAGFPESLDTTELTDVGSNFQFRILLHRNANGEVRLLKDVIQMVTRPKFNELGEITDPGGDLVLLPDESLISEYSGVKLRDGEIIGVRTSTIAYDWGFNSEVDVPEDAFSLAMTGDIGSTLEATLEIPYNLPTNPFYHRYHSDHNNLDAEYKAKDKDGDPVKEAYDIQRTMNLSFGEPDENDLNAGYAQLYGTFSEVVTGLHLNPIEATGRFRLRQLSVVDTLSTVDTLEVVEQ